MSDAAQTPPTPAVNSGEYTWLAHYPENIVWDQNFVATPVYSMLDETVAKYPNQSCSDFLGKKTTYAEIGDLVNRAAEGLQKLGVKKGSTVGLFLPNSPTYIIYYNAILKAGGTVVNYNPLYTVEELEYQVKDSGTDLMITLDLKALFEKVEALIEGGSLEHGVICTFSDLLPGLKSFLFKLFKGKEIAKVSASPIIAKLTSEDQLLANGGNPETPVIDPHNDIAVLQYTGGTTGTPKGAMLTHANLTINVQQAMAWTNNLHEAQEKVMGLLPFFHVFAMTAVLNVGVRLGAEIVMLPRFEINQALALINKHKPTFMPAVPTIFNAMMNHPKIDKFDLSSLKLCLSGGAPLPLEVKRGFEGMTGCTVVEAYGLSETSPAVTINPLEGPVKDSSIGQPLPATIVSLRDLEDPTKEVPQGEKGEICIKGPQVMKGYWNKPGETESTFLDDYLRTGDVGIMDEQGFTFIVDRIKDLIICSGYNVYPRRIEEAIYEYAAVEEVTVIGIKDEYRGEAPKAFIKLKDGHTATAEEILAFLESKISKIELPEYIEFRDELPKTMIGKLSKKELVEEEAAKGNI